MANVKSIGLFPWCIFKDYDSLRSTYFFVDEQEWQRRIRQYTALQSSIEDAMALYWRVRKWRITGTQMLFLPDNEPDYIDFDFVFERNATSELDLICKYQVPEFGTFSVLPLIDSESGDSFATQTYVPSRIFNTSYPMLFGMQIPSSGVFSLPENIPYGGHFVNSGTIATHIELQFIGNNSGGDFDASFVDLFDFDGTNPDQQITLSFLGKEINISAKTNFVAFAEIPLVVGNFKIEAIEYWPYDPEDGGGPVYDQFTGAIIRPDFFN